MPVVSIKTIANPPTNCRLVDNDGMISPIWGAWFDTAWRQLVGMVDNLANAVNDLATVTKANAISASSTIPTELITQADTGTAVRLTSAVHKRLYDGGTFVDVATAYVDAPYSRTVGVFYDDPDLQGGAIVLQYTENIAEAQFSYVPGRHSLGVVTTIAAGAPPVTVPSGGSSPPGSGGNYVYDHTALP